MSSAETLLVIDKVNESELCLLFQYPALGPLEILLLRLNQLNGKPKEMR